MCRTAEKKKLGTFCIKLDNVWCKKFGAKNNLSYAVENYGIQIKFRAVCFRDRQKQKQKQDLRLH